MALSIKQEQAAHLVADDRLSNARIAAEVGVTRRTLDYWKTADDFTARVQEIVQAARAAAMAHGIAVKEERIRGYQERERLYWHLLRERARRGQELLDADASGLTPGGLPLPEGTHRQPAPGVETGLLVRQEKPGPFGPTVEWVVDTGLLSEMRAVEKQTAQEMGQWTDRTETKHDGSDSYLDALRSFGSSRPAGDGGSEPPAS